MALTYRAMAEADLDAVAELERSTNPLPWSRALFAEELKNPGTCHWVLGFEPGRESPVSMGGFWRAVDEAHITNIAVAPDRRRRGLGRELIREMERRAKEAGCVRMTLEVRTGNAPAIALYESLGFTRVALRPHYYLDTKEDALIMWKNELG